jgi:hypothetical protein
MTLRLRLFGTAPIREAFVTVQEQASSELVCAVYEASAPNVTSAQRTLQMAALLRSYARTEHHVAGCFRSASLPVLLT